MIKQEHMSKKSFESDPDGQKKIKLFLKNFQNDIIEKKKLEVMRLKILNMKEQEMKVLNSPLGKKRSF